MKTESTHQVKVLGAAALLWLLGCSAGQKPVFLEPDQLAPAAPGVLWEAPPETAQSAETSSWARPTLPAGSQDLEALLDLALLRNPATRRVWEEARAAAARVARAESTYFPEAGIDIEGGYGRFLFQSNPGPMVIRQWDITPTAELSWILLDFGRRSSALTMAEARLRAANLTANRQIQDVVFAVQRAYYALDAAQAMVKASQSNLERARSVLEAAEERRELGLATLPDVLLARQTTAKAVYDVENARVMVSDAQAALAMAMGVAANEPMEIVSLADLPLPSELLTGVDDLIDDTLADRPDLQARVAELRAREAAVERARAQLYPEVYLNGSIGQDIWWYQIDASPQDYTNQPNYGGQVGLRWSLFEGFDRLNAVREARAQERAARAELEEARLDAIAGTWRVYHDFRAARKKWDYAQALLLASQEAYASNRASYELGLATIVELLTAERDLADALFIHIDARANLLTRAAEVVWVVGASLDEAPS